MNARYDSERRHRRSIRPPGYGYPQPGACFVNIVRHKRSLEQIRLHAARNPARWDEDRDIPNAQVMP